jgi:hypothetical protein
VIEYTQLYGTQYIHGAQYTVHSAQFAQLHNYGTQCTVHSTVTRGTVHNFTVHSTRYTVRYLVHNFDAPVHSTRSAAVHGIQCTVQLHGTILNYTGLPYTVHIHSRQCTVHSTHQYTEHRCAITVTINS